MASLQNSLNLLLSHKTLRDSAEQSIAITEDEKSGLYSENPLPARIKNNRYPKNISVALCTYNGMAYLGQQLRSILNQTVNVNEIIICDDASTDKTWQLIKTWQKNHPQVIKAVQNEDNLGYTKNFEKAISLCTGEIIFLSDQDDIWYEYKVEKILDEFLSNTKCEMVVTDAEVVDISLNRCNATLFSKRDISNSNMKESFYQKCYRSLRLMHYKYFNSIGKICR